MKLYKQAQKYGRRVVPAMLVFAAGAANAAVDIAAETAEAKTDIATAGALIIGVVVAIAVIAWIRKVVH